MANKHQHISPTVINVCLKDHILAMNPQIPIISEHTHCCITALQAKWQQGAVTHQRVVGQVDDLQRGERMEIRHLLQLVALQEETSQPWTQTCQGVL